MNTFLLHRKKSLNVIALCFGITTAILLFIVFSGRALAVTNNNSFVTPSVVGYTNNFNLCGGDQPPNPPDGLRHAQYPWISPAGNTAIEGQVTVPINTDSVRLRFNSVAAHCNKNIGSDGTITLQDIVSTGTYFSTDGGPILRTQILSPTGTGASLSASGITASSPNVLDYRCSHTYSLRYVKRCNNSGNPNEPVVGNEFTLSGLNSFPPGETTIEVEVSINVRQVNRFDNGRYYCVLGRTRTGGLIETNVFGLSPVCRSDRVPMKVIIYRPPISGSFNLNPSVTCSVRNGQIDYRVDKNGTQPANGINVTLQYTRNGTVTTVFDGQVDIPDAGYDRQVTVSGLSVGDSLSARIVVNPGSSPGGGPIEDPADCGELTARPFFRVYGGDVITGRDFDGGGDGVCSPRDSSANVRAYARENGGNWIGAGGQFAVSAAGYINGFMSNNLRNGVSSPTSPPSGLAFSNLDNVSDPSSPRSLTIDGSAGYDVSAYNGCIPDLWTMWPTLDAAFQTHLGSSPGITRRILDSEQQRAMTFRLDGGQSVSILGNIEHRESASNPTPSWASSNEVRTPIILVEGDINIGPEVTRLDGIYFAKGTINTCATTDMRQCNRKLTINGALIAGKVDFKRTNGDYNDDTLGANQRYDSSRIAEVINFTPNIYLVLSRIARYNDVSTNSSYDSIVGLPPVL